MTVGVSKSRNAPLTFFKNIPPELFDEIENCTSYFKQGFERTNAFLRGEWDGRVRLFRQAKTGSWYCPNGIADRVLFVLDIYEIPVEFEHVPEIHVKQLPDGIIGIWNPTYKLRDYQEIAIEQLRDNEWNGIISLPTGGGKTLCAAKVIDLLRCKTLILVHRQELLHQWKRELSKFIGINAGLVGAGECVWGDITIAMVQTLREMRASGKLRNLDFDLVVLDECHTAPCDTTYNVMMACNAKYRIGLSATPERTDGAELKMFAAIGRLAADIRVWDLIDMGYLAEPQFEMISLDPVTVRSNMWMQIYKAGIVNNYDRNDRIMEKAHEMLAEGRQVYVHVTQIAHAKHLAAIIDGAHYCVANTKNRKQIIEDFESGKIRCLVSTLLKEGVSIDNISGLIYAAGGKSEISTIQTIGRCLRMDDTFGNARVVDFLDTGHFMLKNHTQMRIETYRRTYGKYFKQ